MSDGGPVGGLDSLPVNDAMFDGDYADGGLVAFAQGGVADKFVSDDPHIQYILNHESGGGRNFNADGTPLTSPKGAQFAMQVMPGTQRDPGFGVRPAANNTAAEVNRVGVDYANALKAKYGVVGGLMAYNWGPGKYEAWVAGGRKGKVPEETKKYVREATGGKGIPGGSEASEPSPGSESAVLPEVDTDTRQGRRLTLEEVTDWADKRNARLPHQRQDEQEQFIESQRDPEAKKRQRNRDIGFAMLSAAPSLLTSGPLLAAAPAALAKFGEGFKTSDEAARAAEAKGYADLTGLEEKTSGRMQRADETAAGLYSSELNAEDKQKTREQQEAQFQAKLAADQKMFYDELQNRKDVANISANASASGKLNDLQTLALNKYQTMIDDNDRKPVWDGKSPWETGKYRLQPQAVMRNATTWAAEQLGLAKNPNGAGGDLLGARLGGTAPVAGGAAPAPSTEGFKYVGPVK